MNESFRLLHPLRLLFSLKLKEMAKNEIISPMDRSEVKL